MSEEDPMGNVIAGTLLGGLCGGGLALEPACSSLMSLLCLQVTPF